MRRISQNYILYPAILLMPSNALALAIAFWSSALSKKGSTFHTAIILAVSLFLASYNATKFPESDLYNYLRYSNILAESTFLEAIQFSSEPIYYLGNWVFVGIFGLSFNSWIFFVSFIIFFLSLTGIKQILETGAVHGPLIASAIVLTAFSPLMFAQSGHLVRQYLAIGLGIFAIARYIAKERWAALLILAAMTHVTAAVLFLIPIVGALAPRFGKFSWVLTYGLPLSSVGIARLMAVYAATLQAVGGPTFIIYGLRRLGQDEFHTLSDFSLAGYLFVFASISISGLLILKDVARKAMGQRSSWVRLHLFFSFHFMLSLSVLTLALLGITELAIRFSQFLFVITPIGLAYILDFYRARWLLYMTAAAMPVIFFLYPSPWVYGDPVEILVGPYHAFAFDGLLS